MAIYNILGHLANLTAAVNSPTMPFVGRWIARIIRLILFGIYFPAAMLLLICRVRLIALTHPDRIGHLCIEPDCFIKEGILNLRPKFFAIFLIPRDRVANNVVLDLWSRRLTIVTSPLLCAALRPLLSFASVRYAVDHYAVAIEDTAACGAILAKWGNRSPLLEKDLLDTKYGLDVLHALGMPPGSWFVCIHSRDGYYSSHDEHLHSYRNSRIENYLLAMEAIIERGGWCIRVGEPTPNSLSSAPGVIDYANSDKKSSQMDIFLCANCRFFLGNSSGLYLASTIFGVQSALANLIPISGALPVGPDDLGIPKMLRSRKSGELLLYREAMQIAVANFRFGWQYESEGIEVEENSPEDIRDMAIEMMDRLSGKMVYDATDEQLQQKFRELMKPGHYSFGARSRIGRDFLRKNAQLI